MLLMNFPDGSGGLEGYKPAHIILSAFVCEIGGDLHQTTIDKQQKAV